MIRILVLECHYVKGFQYQQHIPHLIIICNRIRANNVRLFTVSDTAPSHLLSNLVLQAHFEITPTTSLGNLPLVYSVPPPETTNLFLNTPMNVINDRLTFCLLVM